MDKQKNNGRDNKLLHDREHKHKSNGKRKRERKRKHKHKRAREMAWRKLQQKGKSLEKVDYEEFCGLCAEIFGSNEAKENEWRIRDVFDTFDRDRDGTLNKEEWKRCYDEWISVILHPVNVLLVVDVQNDFIDGALALRDCGAGQEGSDVIQPINRLLKEGHWNKVIYSLDWHPENHISFYENLHMRELHPDSKISRGEAKTFDTVFFSKPRVEQKLWPKHCVMNTWGAASHKDLLILPSGEWLRKGQNPEVESYSVFFKNDDDDTRTELERILSEIGTTNLYVCGLAYDVCVKATCLDALRLNYPLAVIEDCCRGVDPDDIVDARRLIVENGGVVLKSDDVLSLVNERRQNVLMAHRAIKEIRSANRESKYARR